jgi:hypothetical protein
MAREIFTQVRRWLPMVYLNDVVQSTSSQTDLIRRDTHCLYQRPQKHHRNELRGVEGRTACATAHRAGPAGPWSPLPPASPPSVPSPHSLTDRNPQPPRVSTTPPPRSRPLALCPSFFAVTRQRNPSHSNRHFTSTSATLSPRVSLFLLLPFLFQNQPAKPPCAPA